VIRRGRRARKCRKKIKKDSKKLRDKMEYNDGESEKSKVIKLEFTD
jgi:hypothetical protein